MTAYLLTWKEVYWPYENIRRMLETRQEHGCVTEYWRMAVRNGVERDERVWLLQQGDAPKGIFAAGRILEKPAERSENGDMRWRAHIHFDAFVDPKCGFLIDEDAVRQVLSDTQIKTRASGCRLSDEQSSRLESLLL